MHAEVLQVRAIVLQATSHAAADTATATGRQSDLWRSYQDDVILQVFVFILQLDSIRQMAHVYAVSPTYVNLQP